MALTDEERIVALLRVSGDPTEVAAILGVETDHVQQVLESPEVAPPLPVVGGTNLEDWQAPADLFTDTWRSRAATPVQLRRDSSGKVTLRGETETIGTLYWGNRVLTLPEGYRPPSQIVRILPYFDTGNAARLLLWAEFNADGTVVLRGESGGGAAQGGASSRLVFDGIEFFTA